MPNIEQLINKLSNPRGTHYQNRKKGGFAGDITSTPWVQVPDPHHQCARTLERLEDELKRIDEITEEIISS